MVQTPGVERIAFPAIPAYPERMEAPGSRMAYWIAEACRLTREENGVHQVDIAALVRKPKKGGGTRPADPGTISRFERGSAWPRDADLYVNAYARAAALEDPRQVWERALSLWREHGESPFRGGGSLTGFRHAIESAAPEAPEAHDEPSEETGPDDRRRAGAG